MTGKPHYRRTAAGDTVLVNDGLQSLAANLGVGTTDKARSVSYVTNDLNDQQLRDAFRTSWVCKQVVRLPAKDATRKWRRWTGDRADEIQEAERSWRLRAKVYKAKWLSRLYGGAAILIGTGESLEGPLDPTAIRQGELKYLTVLSKLELASGDIEEDPREQRYSRPKWYEITAKTGSLMRVHPSRVAEFYGEDLPSTMVGGIQNYGWGDSVLQAVYEACVNLDSVMANLASLVFEAKTDVVKIPGLMSKIMDQRYETSLIARMALARQLKGNNGTLVLDADEDYVQRSYSFQGLPDVADRFMQVAAGAADIPVTRLLNQSPSGLNSTGESDLANYYDAIQSVQNNEITPSIAALDEILVRSTIGDYPDGLQSEWSPLRQMTEQQISDLRNKDADTLTKLVAAGVPEHLIDQIAEQMFQQSGLVIDTDEEDDDDE